MKIAELNRKVADAGATARISVRARPQPDLLPDDVMILEPSVTQPGKWVVYYTERGQTWVEGTYDSEDAACDYVATLLPK